jgi:hypothetical protein
MMPVVWLLAAWDVLLSVEGLDLVGLDFHEIVALHAQHPEMVRVVLLWMLTVRFVLGRLVIYGLGLGRAQEAGNVLELVRLVHRY